jgi:hypothetical protein
MFGVSLCHDYSARLGRFSFASIELHAAFLHKFGCETTFRIDAVDGMVLSVLQFRKKSATAGRHLPDDGECSVHSANSD